MIKDFLYLEDDIVRLNPQALTIPEIRKIKASDKNAGKPVFSRILEYTYHMYSPNSIYRHLPEDKRREKVVMNLFSKINPATYEKGNVKAFVEIYKEYSYTQKQRVLDRMTTDLEQMIENLSKIPFSIKVNETHRVFVNCPRKGEEVPVDVRIKKVVDNSAEKMKAMKMIEEALDRQEQLRKKVEKELLMMEQDSHLQRIYDR